MFTKILIANRGEIACRVAATARRLGIKTVAVLRRRRRRRHVHACDEAVVAIGGAAPRESFICASTASEAAKATGAGGASGLRLPERERGVRARPGAAAGLAFIGPLPSAIPRWLSKSAAKALMGGQRAGGSRLPWRDQGRTFCAREADATGYPVPISQRRRRRQGMRVTKPRTSRRARVGQREAQASFGDQHVLIERR